MTTEPKVGSCSALAVAALVGLVAAACGGGASGPSSSVAPAKGEAATRGRELVITRGCVSCHTTNGNSAAGPTWRGSWGRQIPLEDGTTVLFDADYVARSVRTPNAERRAGFSLNMPAFTTQFSDADLADVAAYLQELG